MNNRGRLNQEKHMVRRSSSKFWYCTTTMFLLWFFLVVFYFWGLNSDKSQVGLARNLFVEVHGNNNGNGRQEEGEDHPGGAIDNFFTGGDWKKYLDEAEALNLLQGAPPEEESPLTQNVASSINQVFRERVEELSQDSAPVNTDAESETGKGKPKGAIPEHEIASGSGPDSVETCKGRYIYVHDLPSQFNEDYLKHCRSLSQWSNMCPLVTNFGFGPPLKNTDKVFSNSGWFETNQFMLEIIFHSRMKQYKCLTNDSSLASAIFVPYYGGLDVARYLWNSNRLMRDHYSKLLVDWLREKPEWKKMWGWDHFMVAGRITWDFRRETEGNSDWGNKLMLWPESRNMTMLTIESSPWNKNDFAIPYPTYFHPSSDDQVFQWQMRMRSVKRRSLFAFVGARRPNLATSIRDKIMDQCVAARKKCKLLECTERSNKCNNPANIMQLFQASTFCLQPPGDSYTRRSTFDSILAGCIPVFFHPGSAYVQYLWHLPRDYTKYSVFIPAKGIKEGKESIVRTLSRIPRDRILAMREQVINLIPGVVYADPTSTLTTLEDAFDITVDGVLDRIQGIRKDMESGKNVSDDPDEEITWKKTLFGTTAKHEWDILFDRKNDYKA